MLILQILLIRLVLSATNTTTTTLSSTARTTSTSQVAGSSMVATVVSSQGTSTSTDSTQSTWSTDSSDMAVMLSTQVLASSQGITVISSSMISGTGAAIQGMLTSTAQAIGLSGTQSANITATVDILATQSSTTVAQSTVSALGPAKPSNSGTGFVLFGLVVDFSDIRVIIGFVVGGILLLITIISCCLFCCGRSRRQKEAAKKSDSKRDSSYAMNMSSTSKSKAKSKDSLKEMKAKKQQDYDVMKKALRNSNIQLSSNDNLQKSTSMRMPEQVTIALANRTIPSSNSSGKNTGVAVQGFKRGQEADLSPIARQRELRKLQEEQTQKKLDPILEPVQQVEVPVQQSVQTDNADGTRRAVPGQKNKHMSNGNKVTTAQYLQKPKGPGSKPEQPYAQSQMQQPQQQMSGPQIQTPTSPNGATLVDTGALVVPQYQYQPQYFQQQQQQQYMQQFQPMTTGFEQYVPTLQMYPTTASYGVTSSTTSPVFSPQTPSKSDGHATLIEDGRLVVPEKTSPKLESKWDVAMPSLRQLNVPQQPVPQASQFQAQNSQQNQLQAGDPQYQLQQANMFMSTETQQQMMQQQMFLQQMTPEQQQLYFQQQMYMQQMYFQQAGQYGFGMMAPFGQFGQPGFVQQQVKQYTSRQSNPSPVVVSPVNGTTHRQSSSVSSPRPVPLEQVKALPVETFQENGSADSMFGGLSQVARQIAEAPLPKGLPPKSSLSQDDHTDQKTTQRPMSTMPPAREPTAPLIAQDRKPARPASSQLQRPVRQVSGQQVPANPRQQLADVPLPQRPQKKVVDKVVNPVEVNTAEVKYVEVLPVEIKHVDAKLGEPKATAAKPVEVKPVIMVAKRESISPQKLSKVQESIQQEQKQQENSDEAPVVDVAIKKNLVNNYSSVADQLKAQMAQRVQRPTTAPLKMTLEARNSIKRQSSQPTSPLGITQPTSLIGGSLPTSPVSKNANRYDSLPRGQEQPLIAQVRTVEQVQEVISSPVLHRKEDIKEVVQDAYATSSDSETTQQEEDDFRQAEEDDKEEKQALVQEDDDDDMFDLDDIASKLEQVQRSLDQ